MSTTNTDLLNPSPKTRFLSSEQNVSKHRDMIVGREFERAADFAMLEYQAKLCLKEQNPGVIGLKLCGAAEFLQEMKLLGEKAVLKPIPKVNDNVTVEP